MYKQFSVDQLDVFVYEDRKAMGNGGAAIAGEVLKDLLNNKEEENIIRIQTLIFVERNTQKAILIGKKGAALKKTVTEARKEMERFFGKKIFLETFIKERRDWRNDEYYLKNLGYLS